MVLLFSLSLLLVFGDSGFKISIGWYLNAARDHRGDLLMLFNFKTSVLGIGYLWYVVAVCMA